MVDAALRPVLFRLELKCGLHPPSAVRSEFLVEPKPLLAGWGASNACFCCWVEYPERTGGAASLDILSECSGTFGAICACFLTGDAAPNILVGEAIEAMLMSVPEACKSGS